VWQGVGGFKPEDNHSIDKTAQIIIPLLHSVLYFINLTSINKK